MNLKKEKPNHGKRVNEPRRHMFRPLAPGFVNSEHAAAEITDHTMHVCHEALLGLSYSVLLAL